MSCRLGVAHATLGDLPVVTGLVAEAVEWLRERGVDQWPYPYPEQVVRESIDRGDTYLASLDGEPVATLAVYWEDFRFWGPQPPDAGYLHRLVVARRAAGQGLGARLVDWAAAYVASHNRPYLRLDCGARNAPIREYYERLNFQHIGDVEVNFAGAGSTDRPWRASLYERAIGVSTPVSEVRTQP